MIWLLSNFVVLSGAWFLGQALTFLLYYVEIRKPFDAYCDGEATWEDFDRLAHQVIKSHGIRDSLLTNLVILTVILAFHRLLPGVL